MQLNHRALGAAASGLLFAATLTVSPAWATHVGQLSTTDQKCRESVAKVFGKAVSTAAKVSSGCHKDRNAGKIAAATDCNDLTQADAKGKFAKSQTKLTETIDSLCVTAGASNATLKEFTSCPEPCGTETGVPNPMQTYAQLGECLACLAGDIVERSNADMLGLPALPMDPADQSCHAAIGKGYTKRLSTIVKDRAGCQKEQDKLFNYALTPCETSDAKGKIEGATTKAESGLDSACGSATIASLDSCATTNLADLKACLLVESDAAGAEAFPDGYELPATICPVQINSQILAGWTEAGKKSDSFLEVGWSGYAHDVDLADGYFIASNISCPNTSAPCGDCTVTGISSNGPQYASFARCSNDFSVRCTQLFQPDPLCANNDCVYVLGPPLPISAANNPTCSINALRNDIFGTVNPDTGSSTLNLNLLTKTHTGGSATLTHPCPVCVGDTTAGDGNQNGLCRGGSRDGLACDVDAYDATFGAQSKGEGLALDCPPVPGTNITGVGIRIPFTFTTGHTELAFENKCDNPLGFLNCACGVCTLDNTLPCKNDAECAASSAGTCTSKGSGVARQPNGCGDVVAGCVAAGDDKGECNSAADELQYCDGVVRANGHGIVACATNSDCLNSDCDDVNVGLQSGSCGTTCSLTQPRPCFLNPIVDDGRPDTENPLLVGTFCLAPTNNTAINGAAGNPGPVRVAADMITQLVY